MLNNLNNEIFSSPDKCIEECDKQINFANNLIIYLEQYKVQLETMKTMANSAKVLQEANPFMMMGKFIELMSNSSTAFGKAQTKKKDPESEDA
jgi:hypothetical protein